MDSTTVTQDFYNRFGEREWGRLDRADDGAIEREMHTRAFAAFLPMAPCRVLDIGGGPGRWTVWLAERGYCVTLADLSPRLVEIAQEKIAALPEAARRNVEAVCVADARDLSRWHDASFDAVLSLGAFYHLTNRHDRERAAHEAARVLKPGGRFFAATMPRLFFLLAVALETERTAPLADLAATLLGSGAYHDSRPGRFSGAYLCEPQEVAPFFKRFGFQTLRLMASEGMLATVQHDVAALALREPEAYRQLLDIAYANAGDETILGLAAHLLYIAEKRG